MARDQQREPDVVRITTASSSRNEDIAARQKRYLISMGLRTVCFVSAIVVGPGWLRWALVAAAILLPYVAVVMANASFTKDDGFALQDNAYGAPQLTAGGRPEPVDPPSHEGTA